METYSLNKTLITTSTPSTGLWGIVNGKLHLRHCKQKLTEMNFNDAYDHIRQLALDMLCEGKGEELAEILENFNIIARRKGISGGEINDIYAALLQTLTAVYLSLGKTEDAMRTSAQTLHLLVQDTKRRDEPFLIILALTLYDLSRLHFERSQFQQAEREIEKMIKIVDRLAKNNPDRYASAHIIGQSALTAVVRSRTRQAKMLSEYKEATEKYLHQLNEGIEGATSHLVESLAQEGKTLMSMGKHREAVQYFTRALRYLTKIEPEMTHRQLALSIDLGISLLQIKQTREKGVHLLNTMLHKANKLNASTEYQYITKILNNNKSRQLDILGFWYKLFPK